MATIVTCIIGSAFINFWNFKLGFRPGVTDPACKFSCVFSKEKFQSIRPAFSSSYFCFNIFVGNDVGIVFKVECIVEIFIIPFHRCFVFIFFKISKITKSYLIGFLGLYIWSAGYPLAGREW